MPESLLAPRTSNHHFWKKGKEISLDPEMLLGKYVLLLANKAFVSITMLEYEIYVQVELNPSSSDQPDASGPAPR